MATSTIVNSFISGELSPSVLGRTDKPQYRNGASTMRNGYVCYTGGMSSRAGLAYCGMCKQGAPNVGGTPTANPPRIIEFQYNLFQGFSLEFGDQYMRILSQGGYVTESGMNIQGITQANPAVLNIIGHGYSVGDWVFISGVTGMTNFNGLTWVVSNVIDVNHISLTDLFGNSIDSTAFPAYISGGTTARLYTVVSPYAAVDLPYLKFTQSANLMSLCCVNQQTLMEYPTYNLQRFANTNWQFALVTFASDIGPPSNVVAVAHPSTTVDTNYGYVVTAVDAGGQQESVASSVAAIGNNDISINAGSNTITWNAVPGASKYNVYMTTPAFQPGSVVVPGLPFGYIGTATGTTFTDTNITPDFSTTPPLHNDPFATNSISGAQVTAAGSGYQQDLIGYTINTVNGVGAQLELSVVNGGLAGITLVQGGRDYDPAADTITITSSGAVEPPTQATGSYTFIVGQNPTPGTYIDLNGTLWYFITPGGVSPSGWGTQVQGNQALTLASLVSDLNSTANTDANLATYNAMGAVLNITYKITGVIGNSYTLPGGTANVTASSSTLTGGTDGGPGGGSGASATLLFTATEGNSPSVVIYFQQRRVYANTLDQPDTYFMSKPGAYQNMDSAIPTVDSDAIVGTPWAQQINGIQFFQPTINGLLTFTGNGVWVVSGGNNLAITPADENAQAQAQVGCSAIVPPLYVNLHVLYVQSKNSIVRDVAYNFIYNVFQGTDITVWSSHLFHNYSILQWAYAEEPFKIIWAIRNDGILLSLTYLKEQEIEGWARHDTNGLFLSTCVVTEKPLAAINNPSQFGPLVDAPYFITQRYISGQGVWVYYSERMDDRNWFNVENCFCVDAGLTWPMSYPQATLSPAAATGTNNITSTLVINGGSNYTAPTGQAVDATGNGTGATFSFTVSGGVITVCTPLTGGSGYIAGQTQIIITDSTGSGAAIQPVITNYVAFNASVSVFTPAMIGNVIRVDNGKATIISQTGTACIADITQVLTTTIMNDPNNLPVPAPSGKWSVSVPTTVVNGLNHLEGMTVTGLADGAVIPPVAVVNGTVTLSQPASAIVIGLPYTCQLQTVPLDVPSQTTTQDKRKNITSAVLLLENSRGVQVGSNEPDQSMQPNQASLPWTNMKEIKQRNNLITAGTAIPLFSGKTDPIYIKSAESDWSDKGQLAVMQSYPLPLNCIACIPLITLGDMGS